MHLQRQHSNRERMPRDFYPTPIELCYTALQILPINPNSILDPGAGDGVWGKVARSRFPYSFIAGNDIRELSKPEWYDDWRIGNYVENQINYEITFDLIMGNPPFKVAEKFITKSLNLLRPDGLIVFLLRLEFLASKGRHFRLFSNYPPCKVYVLSRRPSFFSTNGGHTVDAMDYGLFIWQNKNFKDTTLDWLYWEYDK